MLGGHLSLCTFWAEYHKHRAGFLLSETLDKTVPSCFPLLFN